jgi:hypothetical protein
VAILRQNDVPFRRHGGALQIDAYGTMIELGQDT